MFSDRKVIVFQKRGALSGRRGCFPEKGVLYRRGGAFQKMGVLSRKGGAFWKWGVLSENGGCFLQGVLSWKGSCYLDKRVSFPNNWAQSSGHGTLMNISPKPVNILLALGCKTVDALPYYAVVAAEMTSLAYRRSLFKWPLFNSSTLQPDFLKSQNQSF